MIVKYQHLAIHVTSENRPESTVTVQYPTRTHTALAPYRFTTSEGVANRVSLDDALDESVSSLS